MLSADSLLRQEIKQGSTRLPKVLAVEFEVFGHHAQYVQNIADVWLAAGLDGCLEFLLTNRFKKVHADVVEHIRAMDSEKVTTSFITDEEEVQLSRPSLKHWNGWKLFCKYATRSNADLGLFMYFDRFQLPVCFGQKSPIPFAGIYFRPTFHYHTFKGYRPTINERWVALRKQFLLRRVLRNKELKTLLSLDPIAARYIQQHFKADGRISHFADSFPRISPSETEVHELRQELKIEPNRFVFCLIGILDHRKGPIQLLESIKHIPEEVASKICILLAGYTPDGFKNLLENAVAGAQGISKVQIVLRNEYIAPAKVQTYYALSDVLLTTYQFHIGSSSALLRSASQRKPLLSSDYGLLGHLVRTLELGVTVDTTQPKEIANGIVRMASSNPQMYLNISNADRLSHENSQEKLAMDLKQLLQAASNRSNSSLHNSSNL